MDDPSLWTFALLALAGLSAGFVDAVVGGGGLIQLPALVIGLPGASPVQILATNKLAGICGTSVSSVTYYRRVRPDPRTFVPLMIVAFIGSVVGAVAASYSRSRRSTRSSWSRWSWSAATSCSSPTWARSPSCASPAVSTPPPRSWPDS